MEDSKDATVTSLAGRQEILGKRTSESPSLPQISSPHGAWET